MDVADARHLLSRSGFGAAPHEIAALLPLTREAAVEQLLAGLDTTEVAAPPPFLREPMTDYLTRIGDYAPPSMTGRPAIADISGSAAERLTFLGMQEMAQLRVWWLDQMISTPSPLTERIALFWHNHFTTQYFDVLTPRLLFDELQTIRRVGIDNFGKLLNRMLRDPAMLIYLDNALNTRSSPNENFAREVLELFTLGIGNYTQTDVREFARILAGHSVDFGGTWAYKVRAGDLDPGMKHLLGRSGAFALDDASRILLDQPSTARFLATKFHREFISPEIDPVEVDRLAGVMVDAGYAIVPFLRALFTGTAFWSARNRGQAVKSPVVALVGFCRSFGVHSPDGEALASYAAMLGQELFEPPSVQGWKGGLHWLDPQAIGLRAQVFDRLWQMRQSGLAYQAAGDKDLMLRFSGETEKGIPVAFTLRVNGVPVCTGTAQAASDAQVGAALQPKPAWELARVARDRLPPIISSVEVVFATKGGLPRLFVNWIQIDGRRWPVQLATVKDAPPQAAGVPIGMMFQSGTLHFDIAALAAADPTEPTIADRTAPPNSVIEYATARITRADRPAGHRGPVPVRAVDSFAGLPRDLLQTSVLAAAPLRRAAVGSVDDEVLLRRWTRDPAYNLV